MDPSRSSPRMAVIFPAVISLASPPSPPPHCSAFVWPLLSERLFFFQIWWLRTTTLKPRPFEEFAQQTRRGPLRRSGRRCDERREAGSLFELRRRRCSACFHLPGRGIAEKILPGSNLAFRLSSLCPLGPNADPICSRASSSSRLA
jgi:hypothetical protein